MGNDPYLAEDIGQGIVVFLDPDVLESQGAVFTSEDHRVQGPHFFLCLGAKEEETIWITLYSRQGLNRGTIPAYEQIGPHFEGKPSHYYHNDGLVLANREQVVAAAGEDYSRRGGRRYVSPFYTGKIADVLIPGW